MDEEHRSLYLNPLDDPGLDDPRDRAGHTLSVLRTVITDPGAGYRRPSDERIVDAIDVVLNQWQDEEEARDAKAHA